MAIDFPNVKFDWLAEIPQIAEESRLRRARASLGDLKLRTSNDLSAAADRLAGMGDFEGALKLSALATQRKSAEASMLSASQRGLMDQYILGLMKGGTGGGLFPSRGGGGGEPTVPTPSVPAAPPAPAPALPGLPGLPGVGGVGPGAALTPSPSEEVLARAEGPPGPVGPPTQLAQAGGPTELPAAPTMAPTAPVPFAPAQQAPAFTPPPATPLPPPVTSTAKSPRQQAMDEVDALTAMAPRFHPRVPGYAAYQARLRDAINRAEPSQPQRDFIEENVRRAQAGEGLLKNEAEFDLYKKTQFPTFEDARKYQDQYRTDERQAVKDNSAIQMFKAIVNHPAYEAGPGTEDFNTYKSMVRNWKDLLISSGYLGADNPISKQIDTATASVPLREAAQALSSQLVISSLGGLGSGRSDSDRIVTALSIPGNLQSKDGSRILADYMSAKNENARVIGQKIRNYMKEKGHNAKPWEVDQIARDYADSHPILVDKDGKPTELGKRLDALRPPAAPVERPPRATPPPGGEPVTGPKGRKGWLYPGGRIIHEDELDQL